MIWEVVLAFGLIAAVVFLLRNWSGPMYTSEEEMFGRDKDKP